ncbi:NUDIX hydrolase [Bacillus sp. 1P06AnD]|uniref:NUDIX hydrolase n=1 Tax=Bacillus sp. 1P06AnD TaxID=3132208 RepID=UPI00399FEFDC
MKKFEEKTVGSQKIFEGKVITLQVDEVRLPDGKMSKREIVKHPGAVAIMALTEDRKLLMVEQYRKALERSIIEIPAGKLEKGEDPLHTAHRELEEETGYGCKSMKKVVSFYTSPGFADEILHVYVAEGLEKIDNPAAADDDEFVELMEISLEEGERLIEEGRIADAKTVYAIQYLQVLKASGKL